MTKNDVKFLNQSKREYLWPIFSELKFINLERTYGVFSIFKQ